MRWFTQRIARYPKSPRQRAVPAEWRKIPETVRWVRHGFDQKTVILELAQARFESLELEGDLH